MWYPPYPFRVYSKLLDKGIDIRGELRRVLVSTHPSALSKGIRLLNLIPLSEKIILTRSFLLPLRKFILANNSLRRAMDIGRYDNAKKISVESFLASSDLTLEDCPYKIVATAYAVTDLADAIAAKNITDKTKYLAHSIRWALYALRNPSPN